jgi:DNA topoisomerase VI subunit B
VVAKELVDNALDAGALCDAALLGQGAFYVVDNGDGIPGDDARIAHLFSINRPLTSTKLLRLPTRGCFGNGLRVVAGAVLASGGSLVVETRGRRLHLIPQEMTGETTAQPMGSGSARGTRVEVHLGPALPIDESTLTWAHQAILMTGGTTYAGKTSVCVLRRPS